MTGYYDYILGLIPVSFLIIAVPLLAAGAALTVAVSTASLAGVALVGHAMFVNGPGDAPEGHSAEDPVSANSGTAVAAD
ncbi:MAG: hypothetical protein ABEJ30_01640 [Halorientalis sp.]